MNDESREIVDQHWRDTNKVFDRTNFAIRELAMAAGSIASALWAICGIGFLCLVLWCFS